VAESNFATIRTARYRRRGEDRVSAALGAALLLRIRASACGKSTKTGPAAVAQITLLDTFDYARWVEITIGGPSAESAITVTQHTRERIPWPVNINIPHKYRLHLQLPSIPDFQPFLMGKVRARRSNLSFTIHLRDGQLPPGTIRPTCRVRIDTITGQGPLTGELVHSTLAAATKQGCDDLRNALRQATRRL